MAIKSPYRPKKPFPVSFALLSILCLLFGIVITAEITSRAFAQQLGPSASAVLGRGVRSGSPWVDPRKAVPIIAGYDWGCNGIQLNTQSASHLLAQTGQALSPRSKARCSVVELAALAHLNWIMGVGAGASFAVAFMLILTGEASRTAAASRAMRRAPRTPPKIDLNVPPDRRPFALHVGKSTGTLMELGHGAAIAANRDIVLVDDDASQNVILYGGIGSGKTNLVNRFVLQALKQACGILAFDVKGEWGDTFKALAAMVGVPVVTIGIGGAQMNLLEGVTPEVAANFLKSALLLAGSAPNGVVYLDTATNYAKNLLGMLSFFPERYSLRGLYDAIFDEAARKTLRAATIAKLAGMNQSDRVRLTTYFTYVSKTFPSFDARIKKGAETSLSQILDAFQLEEIDRAFCQVTNDGVTMNEVLDGTVFLLDLPIAVYGLSAKTVYTFVKLRFFNVVQRRRREKSWNQTRRLVFFCDEAQEVISVAKEGLSDLTFWDKSRGAGCVGVYAGQGFESFRAVIQDSSLTNALLQNFRQQIIFRNEDPETQKRAGVLLGKVAAAHTNKTKSTSNSTNSSSSGQSEQTSVRDEELINGQFFRTQLPRGRALALLSIDGEAYDDVVTVDYLPIPSSAPHQSERQAQIAI